MEQVIKQVKTPTPLELRVMMDRVPGVVYPCLVCGGRASAATGMSCSRCGGTGEEPAGTARDVAYGLDRND